jgi:hypothetical protein
LSSSKDIEVEEIKGGKKKKEQRSEKKKRNKDFLEKKS